ncbi:MAG: maltose alpha-D-glucosyltransferase [Desulfovibrionaceae bacterium CG1_02_65_16]|nr:MAG: maltose alpha-D-glucosyltransferase [Desulfovibrionaceae bacterium CG1_02_65_16]
MKAKTTRPKNADRQAFEQTDPTWYKDAVIYEVHVRSFFDSNQSGHGDFLGLKGKLDYLQDLGVTALWLLPFYPSPLRDDGYDIADYCGIHPAYGTLADFRSFLREAHRRGIRVITELVLNHTSDQHAWFQRARKAPAGSPERDFYVWSDTPAKFAGTRIIFNDSEHSNWSWDHEANAYYWHRFYSHQPDLNFDNPQVLAELLRIVDFWLGMGVDGLRLDAVPYLYEREGTNCENLPETFALLKRLRAHVDAKHPGRMLLAEANQWPEDAARYFGAGDMSQMIFHFPLMTRLFVALEMEDRAPVMDILEQTPQAPENCQWAIFLRNHDELTLEMVSEEERDFMYQVYARDRRARINLGIRRRLAPLLKNDRRKIELMNVLLMTMSGSPVIYYGDEIGMGDNYYLGDRDGVRTPMQWSPDKNAGFSRVNPQRLYLPVVIDPEYHYQAVNVENQQRNPSSLLWWMKQLIGLRRRHRALGRGSMRMLRQDSSKVLAYERTLDGECLLVVVNLSRHAQAIRLDLSPHAGGSPVEVFGRSPFPVIGTDPYPLTLGPHGYYVLELHTRREPGRPEAPRQVLRRQGSAGWRFLDTRIKAQLQRVILPEFLSRRSELAGHGRQIVSTSLLDALPVGTAESPAWLCVLETKGAAGGEAGTLLLSYADMDEARRVERDEPGRYVCALAGPPAQGGAAADAEAEPLEGALVEGGLAQIAHTGLLRLFARRRRIAGRLGEFVVSHGRRGWEKPLRELAAKGLELELLPGASDNTLIVYGRRVLLKIFRRTAEGGDPDLEVLRHLTEKAGFAHTPEFLGALRYERSGGDSVVVAMMRRFVPSDSTAWDLCATALGLFLNHALAAREQAPTEQKPVGPAPDRRVPDEMALSAMALIGRRTAEMHAVLARPTDDPGFAPEPFDKAYSRAVYQDIFGKTRRILDQLELARQTLPPEEARLAEQALALRDRLTERLLAFRDTPVGGLKIRVHGEYDLRHLLFTGRDFMIVDFEGRTTRSLSARRLKRSPLRDVCDLLGSLTLVVEAVLGAPALGRSEDAEFLRDWAEHWRRRMAGHFLQSYLEAAVGAQLLPPSAAGLDLVLGTFRIDQTLYELGQMLEAREAGEMRESVPLGGLLRTLCRLLSNTAAEEPSREVR